MAKREALTRRNKLFLMTIPLAVVVAVGILVFSSRKFITDSFCGCGKPDVASSGEFQTGEELAVFNNQPAVYRMADLLPALEATRQAEGKVLGIGADQRWIEVDLSEQKLYAHNGGRIDYEFLISGGKWAPTPTGEFRVWIKLKYAKMSGGRKENNTYYYLPNVPFIQYFYKGYGLHGAYWHNNFGQPMSHGCINLAIPDAEKLFYWTSPSVPSGKGVARPSKDEPGTRIIIHG